MRGSSSHALDLTLKPGEAAKREFKLTGGDLRGRLQAKNKSERDSTTAYFILAEYGTNRNRVAHQWFRPRPGSNGDFEIQQIAAGDYELRGWFPEASFRFPNFKTNLTVGANSEVTDLGILLVDR